ncbi:MAG: Gfo/Idh/MocA family oxidoreductase, partial [Microcella sp.]|nr:Gfo/Idh/MocA family oxidoreductase [Microcella sp.]
MATTPSRPTPDVLRVGVVGLGYAGTTHLTSFLGIDGVEVIALAGKEADRLGALGAMYELPHLFSDWQDLVALPELDVVSIATPNALHHPI